MIVLTSVSTVSREVMPTDQFELRIEDNMKCEVCIREEITVCKVIDFIASYRFALEDGTCPGFHLCGIFGNQTELPKEILEAKRLEDLTDEQYNNFVGSVGVKLKRHNYTSSVSNPAEVWYKEPRKNWWEFWK